MVNKAKQNKKVRKKNNKQHNQDIQSCYENINKPNNFLYQLVDDELDWNQALSKIH